MSKFNYFLILLITKIYNRNKFLSPFIVSIKRLYSFIFQNKVILICLAKILIKIIFYEVMLECGYLFIIFMSQLHFFLSNIRK